MGIVIALVQKQDCGDRALLAAHLAHHWSHKNRKIGLIDLDSKKYLSRWAGTHLSAGLSMLGCEMWRLRTNIKKSRDKNDITLIDCPTHPNHLFRSVCRETDLILVPCSPNSMATHSILTIQTISKNEGTPCCVVLNHVSGHNASYDQALIALKQQHAKILKTQLGNHISFQSGFYCNKSKSDQDDGHSGWDEVDCLRQELDNMLRLGVAA